MTFETFKELVADHLVGAIFGALGAAAVAGFAWVRRRRPAPRDYELREALAAFWRANGHEVRSKHSASDGILMAAGNGGRSVPFWKTAVDELAALEPLHGGKHFRTWSEVAEALAQWLDERDLELPFIPTVEPAAGERTEEESSADSAHA